MILGGSTVITAVAFDVGEVLVDETRENAAWADWLGVPRHTFSAVLGALMARGRDAAEIFQVFRPGFDFARERTRREAAGRPELIEEGDLYPDVRPALTALREAGLWVGIAGNQTERAGHLLRALGLPADLVGTSHEWSLRKPDPRFFARVAREAGRPPEEILYVGDRWDNDIRPALAAGMRAAHIRRGPWAYIDDADVTPTMRVESLAELPAAIAAFNAGR
jgi:HAD superfamily hydrolase (TIGR01549 family)